MANRLEHPTDLAPDPRLRFDFSEPGWRELPRTFFLRETMAVARDLLGVWIARRFRGKWHGARIVETEAYLGEKDAAAHTWRGRRTRRVEPMYREGGHLYVFLVYGMHHCANVVTRPAKLLSGPGKLCAALGLTVAFSGMDLLGSRDVRLFCRDGEAPTIGTSARIGVNYAGEAKDWPLRFFDLSSPSVSGKKQIP
jgi:DNA-3-methyladenine glycosylase